jgi:sulfate permease, SulP family
VTVGELVPASVWLRGDQQRWLSKEVLGGLSAGAVVVPQAMAR